MKKIYGREDEKSGEFKYVKWSGILESVMRIMYMGWVCLRRIEGYGESREEGNECSDDVR